jgi:hypothetical protein
MAPMLRLYEDVLSNGADIALPAMPRMIFVVHGSVEAAGRAWRDDEAWCGVAATSVKAGRGGATLWRWELAARDGSSAAAAPGVVLREKLSARLDALPKGQLLLRGDSVSFPPGGCAYLHRHQGPGIRCLIEGGIRIDAGGHSTAYGPGSPWYESGPEPVFAQAADRPTRFIRVMVLPLSCLGKSSVEYLRDEDKDKPRTQKYKIYGDMPIAD